MSTAPEYLLAIYIARTGANRLFRRGTLGEMLDRSPAAVTEMVSDFRRDGPFLQAYDG
ncbi:hypothetical protein C8039_10735 [Halogeometricum sp. wsp3]|nr:hypothetical protein C8039_10735 [Halogeometricum sp. wsp3]